METCDQITIECNRSQAVIADNTTNASWVNTTPSIILNPGDQIECVGSWISVKNAGDDSIQVVNLTDPDQNLDISFKFSFYKSLNGQNIVTYPVNSFAWTRENSYPQSLIMYGFANDPNKIGSATEYGLSNQVDLPLIDGTVSNQNPFVDPSFDDAHMAEYATYDSLINEQDADVYNLATDGLGYLAFLQNVGVRQGVRDLAGNNERYTAIYQNTSSEYELYTHTVNASFSPQYASPVNIASFITESMNQQKALVTAYSKTTPLKEAWTNSLRYFRTIEPYAVPNMNISTVPSGYQSSSNAASTTGTDTIASYGSISHDTPSQTGLCIDFTLSVTQITYQNGGGSVNLDLNNRCRLRGTYAPQNSQEARKFNYLYHMVRNYSGNNLNNTFYRNNQDQLEYMYKVYTTSGTDYGKFNPTTNQLDTGYKPGDPNTLNGYTVYNLAFHCPELDCFQIAVSNQGAEVFKGQYPSGGGFPLEVGGALYGCMAAFDPSVPFPNTGPGTQDLAITEPIVFDPSTGPFGTYTMEMFLLTVNNDIGIPSNAGLMTPGSNPDGIPLRLSVGGNPNPAGFKTADPVPMGCPLWVGADATTYPGSPYLNTQDDGDYPSGFTVNDAQRASQSDSEYAWCPYVLNLPQQDSGGTGQRGKLNTYNESGGTTDDGTQFKFNKDPYINERFLEYTNGNKLLGCTALNHNRWSLMNYDKPPKLDDPETDVDFQPTMVKFPHFFVAGSKLWDPDTKLMMNVDRDLSTLKFSPLLQRGNRVVEKKRYNTEAEAQARTDLWRQFIKAQIEDGMIDKEEGTTTLPTFYGNRKVFPAYSHVVLELGANVYNANGSTGSDYAWRQRPRGLLIAVDLLSMNQKAPIASSDGITKYSGGVRYVFDSAANNYYIQIDTWSWIFDKSYEGIFANGETTTGYPTAKNYGFIDMNVVKNDYQTGDTLNIYTKADIKDSSGNPNHLQDACPDPSGNLINYCFGWSDKCSAWKNHIGYLSTTTLRNPDDYKFMFNFTTNRQSSNYQSRTLATGSGTNRLFQFGEGDVEYANRVALGCRQPLLSFGTDGNSRFFFSQLFQPIQVQNTFRGGTDVTDSLNVVSTCQDGIFNLVDLANDGYTQKTDSSTTPPTTTTSISIAAEENAGTDAVFYQRRLWNTFLDGFPIMALEYGKHYPCYWKQKGGSGNDDSARKCGNHLGLETFETNFPVLDDEQYNTRFFMFPQQARVNAFQNSLVTNERYVESKIQVGSNLTNRTVTFLSPEKNYPSAFFGCLAGDRVPYINNKREVGKENQVREYQNGTDCPQADKIYDVQTGVFLADFIKWDESNWTESLWDTMGYSYEDLNPSPWVGVRQARNFTKNFLQPEIQDDYANGVFHQQSYPLTTNASLSSSGFIPNSCNLVGELNATLPTPPSSLFFTGNIQSQDFKTYELTSLSQANPLTPGGGLIVFNRTGGSNQINNELFFYEFFNLKIDSTAPYGSYILASSVPSKLEVPFYLVKTDLVENNYSYVNDANTPANLPVCGCIGLQYSNTSDWYYSTNQLDTSFTVKKKRVVTQVRVELVDSNMNLASTLLDKSSVFFRITRADPTPFTMRDPENLVLLEDEMKKEDKKGYDEYEDEVEAYLGLLD